MHGMSPKKPRKSTTKRVAPAPIEPLGIYQQHPEYKKRHMRFPTTTFLRSSAPHKVPFFSYEYGDTGAGADVGVGDNWAAFDRIKIVPRYGLVTTPPPVDVELFGRKYSAPIGIAPMGGPSIVWPGADLLMAKAAQAARIPYTLSTAGGATIEEAARAAPDVFWLQLYRFALNDHKIGFDLVRRAQPLSRRLADAGFP